jgi:hypothetical protein
MGIGFGACSARLLGENAFPPEHPANQVFEQATWEAKTAINQLRSDLLETVSKPPFDLTQAILTFRVRAFSAGAHAVLAIVGNEATAEWYERWLNVSAESVLKGRFRKGSFVITRTRNASTDYARTFAAHNHRSPH